MEKCLSVFAGSVVYDRLMRLPILAFNAYFIVMEVGNLRQYLNEHPAWGAAFFDVLCNVATRVALLSFFALLFVFHLVRMRPVGKSEGPWPRLVALCGVCLVFGWALLPRAVSNPAYDQAALFLILLGNLLSIVSVSHLGRALSVMPEARRLVTSGPYAVVRHPLYVAEAISLFGIYLGFRSVAGVVLLAAILFFQFLRLRYEESVLRRHFDEYAAYANSVPCLVPGWRSLSAYVRHGGRVLFLTLAGAATVTALAWGLVTWAAASLSFPIVEIDQPGVRLTVLKPPLGSSERCLAVLAADSAAVRRQCPECLSTTSRCETAPDSSVALALRGAPGVHASLLLPQSAIVVQADSPASELALCQSMLAQPGMTGGRCIPAQR
ncbi:methyltransferase family protein [Propionivibrio dicarboxylicus]|nr:isoprenylcysteine carboxylmethyltransferase family protein [Propionivibrio dicarboxylicus]